jgi:hypothetical protein
LTQSPRYTFAKNILGNQPSGGTDQGLPRPNGKESSRYDYSLIVNEDVILELIARLDSDIILDEIIRKSKAGSSSSKDFLQKPNEGYDGIADGLATRL